MNADERFKRHQEGLRILASMIADAYRKGKVFPKDEKEPLVSEDEIIKSWEPDDEGGFIYTETVPIEVFKRRKRKKSK